MSTRLGLTESGQRRYKPLEDCREDIKKYAKFIRNTSKDESRKKRDVASGGKIIRHLRCYDHWLDDNHLESPRDIVPVDVEDLSVDLADNFFGTTPRERFDAIKTFHHWLARRTGNDPFQDLVGSDFELYKETEQEQLVKDEDYPVTDEQVELMMENCGSPKRRNQLIIKFMYQTGVRRGEAAGIELEDLDRDTRTLHVREEVAKYGKERYVAWQPSLDPLLDHYIDEGLRKALLAGKDSDNLFIGERGADLSGEAINNMVKTAAQNAGINQTIYADANAKREINGEDENGDPIYGEPIENRWQITSHNIRVGFGTRMVENDCDIYKLSKAMGHSSVEVTEKRYAKPKPDIALEDVRKFGPN
ncbi:site-specific integrase [Halorubrum ezzemoulense]|uniref:Site-specific integrase n=1 Tax=Halorubrum ezzemoulense TaxID=337243 RepID=A0ABT4Z876_HALEZ|nr:site-specific integrase [Halorubrum ezzemoulense]MDB2294364.1 site-specific integrase [Halorubrum ezzemoulense]